MKKLGIIITALTLVQAPAAFAGNGGSNQQGSSNGAPFQALSDAIDANADAIDANADAIDANGDSAAANADAIAVLEAAIAALTAALDALTATVADLEAQLADSAPTTGTVDVPAFSGSYCDDVAFASPFAGSPKVYATANHRGHTHGPNIAHHPVVVWLEEINTTGFRFCVREVDADNNHDLHVQVDWLAM